MISMHEGEPLGNQNDESIHKPAFEVPSTQSIEPQDPLEKNPEEQLKELLSPFEAINQSLERNSLASEITEEKLAEIEDTFPKVIEFFDNNPKERDKQFLTVFDTICDLETRVYKANKEIPKKDSKEKEMRYVAYDFVRFEAELASKIPSLQGKDRMLAFKKLCTELNTKSANHTYFGLSQEFSYNLQANHSFLGDILDESTRASLKDSPETEESIINFLKGVYSESDRFGIELENLYNSMKDNNKGALSYLLQRTISDIPLDHTNISLFNPMFQDYNLDSDELSNMWHKNANPDNSDSYNKSNVMKKNLITMSYLEFREPGICKTLHDEFGIANFGRYPSELLLEQYRTRNKPKEEQRPYIAIATAQTDHNGALYNQFNFYDDFQADTDKEGYDLRIIEVNSKESLNHRLFSLYRKYGKISDLFINAHGDPSGMDLGQNDEMARITTDDLYMAEAPKVGQNTQTIKSIFTDNPSFIFLSCDTGNGFSQKVSETMNSTTIAPTEVITGMNVDMSKDSTGKLHYSATYQGKNRSINPELTRVYTKGEQVQ